MIKPFHNAAVVPYKSEKQGLGCVHIPTILYLFHIKVELRLNIRYSTEHREIGTTILVQHSLYEVTPTRRRICYRERLFKLLFYAFGNMNSRCWHTFCIGGVQIDR